MHNSSFENRTRSICVEDKIMTPKARRPKPLSPRKLSPLSGEKLVPSRWSPTGWRYIDKQMTYLEHPNKKNFIHPRISKITTNEFKFVTTN